MQEIQIKEVEVSKLDIKEGETLLVRVDIGTIPPKKAETFLKDIAKSMQKVVPKNVKVVVMPSKIDVSVLTSSQVSEQE